MHVRRRQAIIPLLSMCAAACSSDTTGALDIVTLCPKATWAAVEREGQAWQSIPATQTTLPLRGDERIGLARIRGAGFPDSLQIYYLTTEQAAATFSCDGDTPPTGTTPATKDLNGTVQGVGATPVDALGAPPYATITMGDKRGSASDGSLFTINFVPGGPVDLVASVSEAGPAAIIRRGVDYADGSMIPILDFGSAEAFALQANTATVIGTANLERQVTSQIITQRGTLGTLRYQFESSGAGTITAPMYSVPENKLLNGELNSLSATDGYAQVTVFYRLPADRTVEVGPPANWPTVTRSGTGSDLTTRIDQVSQPEYGSQITLRFGSPLNATINGKSTIIASKEYFGGTPAMWSFTIPDFRTVDGFPSSWGDVRSSGLNGALVTDRPYLAPARDGVTYRSALR